MNTKTKNLLICLLIPLATGALSSVLTLLLGGFAIPNPPGFTPPAPVFPIVWTILYLLMGISSSLISISKAPGRPEALKLYGLQLFFNFMWSIFFFGFGFYLFSFFWLLLMILVIAAMILLFCRISPFAGILQLPYLLWCCFALILNMAVYIQN